MAEQIRRGITDAIDKGLLVPGARLPSWRDLAAQLGVARGTVRTVRAEGRAAASYPDPRGELDLRRELAVQLAIARGIECTPSQIIITSGFSGGLGLTLHVLGWEGRTAWVEDPSFPLTRKGLEMARLQLMPVPVDEHGLDVAHGLNAAPDAGLVMVTPGQQAPLGATLSIERRLRLLEWAAAKSAWIIEDDYLSELKLRGRSAPALASLDKQGRVIHFAERSTSTRNEAMRW